MKAEFSQSVFVRHGLLNSCSIEEDIVKGFEVERQSIDPLKSVIPFCFSLDHEFGRKYCKREQANSLRRDLSHLPQQR